MKKTTLAKTALAVSLAAFSLSGQAETFYGLSQNSLFRFDSANPGAVSGAVPVSGLGSDTLLGIDIRPSTGQLYGLGSSLRFYTIDPLSGAASLVNQNSFGSSASLSYGFDFNPVPDAVRAVNDAAQNFRVSPAGVLLGNDGALAYAAGDANAGRAPFVVAVAYGNNVGGATTTFLRGIDTSSDTVVVIQAPNTGELRTLGPLGVDTTDKAAFDISGFTGDSYASLTRPGDTTSGFYRIDPATGAATLIGQIGFAGQLDGLTAATVPEPSTWALLSLCAGGWLARALFRRKN